MLLLNIVYGLIMGACMTVAQWVIGGTNIDPVLFFFAVWGGWTTAHILQDIIGYWLVKLFNKDQVVTMDDLRR